MNEFMEELRELIEEYATRTEEYADDCFLIEFEDGEHLQLDAIQDSVALDDFKEAQDNE